LAFPLFGKKPPPSPLAGKAPAQPTDNSASLGADEEPVSLDFTQTGETRPRSRRPRIEVQETIHEIPQAIEQAAMLYSIEQPGAASEALEAAIHGGNLGDYAGRAWGMLFELYQVQSRRQDYEHLAAEFAAKFETSPPAWATNSAVKVAPDAPAASKTSVNLTGVLNAKSQEALKQVFRIAEKNPSVRLEVGKVTDVDEQGCALLSEVFRQLKKARKECLLGGAEKLTAIVAKKVEPGQRELEPVWLLLLELYQRLADQEAFEEAAVNYAVTFEVSPPSFEVSAKRPVAAASVPKAKSVSDTDDAVCALEGIITSNSDVAFASIRLEAETASDIAVDVSRLQRMDFVAATNLMNLIGSLAVAHKKVRLIKASHLLTALWEVIGLDRVARIETRKA
jgi:ABC-type transporter Mla MlaB component